MGNNKLYIRGCGGHARSVADVALFNQPDLELVFVDENAEIGEKIFGFDVIKTMPDDAEIIHHGFGDNEQRNQLKHEKSISIISKKSHISPTAKIGEGTFVAHNAYIGPGVIIGRGCIIKVII